MRIDWGGAGCMGTGCGFLVADPQIERLNFEVLPRGDAPALFPIPDPYSVLDQGDVAAMHAR